MKKSGWISFCGWATWGLILAAVAGALLAGGTHIPPSWAPLMGLAVFLSIPAAGLWVLGTVVHRFRVGGAKLKAQAMVDAQRASVMRCDVCSRGVAVARCGAHDARLCATCWGKHHQEGVCSYVHLEGAGMPGAVAAYGAAPARPTAVDRAASR